MSTYMKTQLEKAIATVGEKSYVNKKTVEQFSKRIEIGAPFTKKELVSEHFCSFFVPYNSQTHSIFVGHHKKANDWIPPGGHLDPGESPLQTVVREFHEELGVVLKKEPIYLVDASITDITHPLGYCKKHYDFWHVVLTDKIKFKYDSGEFYDAGWYSVDYVWQTMIKRTEVKNILQRLSCILSTNGFKNSVIQ